MALAGAINVLLSLEHSKFTTGTKKAGASLKGLKTDALSLNSAMSGLQSTLGALGIGIGISQTMSFLTDSVAQFQESHKSALKLNAVLEATGGVSGRTSVQINAMADELEKLTAVDDAVIRGGAAVLATFKSLSGDGFDRALKASLDLSAAMDGDLKGAAMQLGKALSDPINGLAALGRAGVKFTDAQKEQIKQLVESNRLWEAQALILEQVEGRVKGTAEAMVTEVDRLGVSWGNLKESIGELLVTGGEGGFLGWLSSATDRTTGLVSAISKLTDDPNKVNFLKMVLAVRSSVGLGDNTLADLGMSEFVPNEMVPFSPLDSEGPRVSPRDEMFAREIARMQGDKSGFGKPPRLMSDAEMRRAGMDPDQNDDFLFGKLERDRNRATPGGGADAFGEALERGMRDGLDGFVEKAQQDNLERHSGRFRGFGGGAERGSAEALRAINAFRFQDTDKTDHALEEAKRQNINLEDIKILLKTNANIIQEVNFRA